METDLKPPREWNFQDVLDLERECAAQLDRTSVSFENYYNAQTLLRKLKAPGRASGRTRNTIRTALDYASQTPRVQIVLLHYIPPFVEKEIAELVYRRNEDLQYRNGRYLETFRRNAIKPGWAALNGSVVATSRPPGSSAVGRLVIHDHAIWEDKLATLVSKIHIGLKAKVCHDSPRLR